MPIWLAYKSGPLLARFEWADSDQLVLVVDTYNVIPSYDVKEMSRILKCDAPLTLCLLSNFACFYQLKELFQEHHQSDQARRYVGPDLGTNCLQRSSANDASRLSLKVNVAFSLSRIEFHLYIRYMTRIHFNMLNVLLQSIN